MSQSYNPRPKVVDNISELLSIAITSAKKLSNLSKYHIIAGAWINRNNHSIRTNRPNISTVELEHSFDERLIKALAPLGRLGEKSKKKIVPIGEKRNYLGNCAEQRACNDVLIKDKSLNLTIEQIQFTDAIRIRDLKRKDYCYNCRFALHLHN